ncbi:hypothetical protein S40288_11797 [Stachybotrys chartarum IBT 40288]|nr:hypothetical protein S40288_11797 [Stachybotrys chartarum IBT 40288]
MSLSQSDLTNSGFPTSATIV